MLNATLFTPAYAHVCCLAQGLLCFYYPCLGVILCTLPYTSSLMIISSLWPVSNPNTQLNYPRNKVRKTVIGTDFIALHGFPFNNASRALNRIPRSAGRTGKVTVNRLFVLYSSKKDTKTITNTLKKWRWDKRKRPQKKSRKNFWRMSSTSHVTLQQRNQKTPHAL